MDRNRFVGKRLGRLRWLIVQSRCHQLIHMLEVCEKLTAKNTTPLTITTCQLCPSTLLEIYLQNFQNLSKTLLCIPSRVTIVSALLAMTSKMGQMAIVSRATRITGTREVIADAAFGFASSQSRNCGKKPAMLVKDVNAQSRETGKICAVISIISHFNCGRDSPKLV
jgi:hypothetical protein